MHRRSLMGILFGALALGQEPRRRVRDWGIVPGRMPVGKWNAITDVAGVKVGHRTLIQGARIRSGVTVILPHGGNLFQDKLRAAIFVGNGFGKLMGSTQVNELGQIESPIALTATLNVPRVADALLDYALALPGNEEVRSMNVVVGETNDARLNDIRARAVGREDVFAAIQAAKSGPVEEGAVGAGTGTICFGWKGGIGTASRLAGKWTVGALVQSNYGGALRIAGRPWPSGKVTKIDGTSLDDGSVMVILATDAPLEHRELTRLGARAMWGLGRTGSSGSNGSGDYAIAFSTAREGDVVKGDALSALLEGVIEVVEEAVLNSLFMARGMSGNGARVEALPVAEVVSEMRKRGMLQ